MNKSKADKKNIHNTGKIMICGVGGGVAIEIEALLSAFKCTDRFVFALPRIEAGDLIRRFGAKHFFVMKNVAHSRRKGLKRSPYFWLSAIRKCTKKMQLYGPDITIVIGTVNGLPLLVACRVLGIKCVFIESLARVESLSLTGKIVYYLRLCDYFLVQWPSLAQSYSRAMYKGAVYDLRHCGVDVF